jgi:hypothetical protein
MAVKERRMESKAIPAGAVFSWSHTTEPGWRTGGDVGKAGRLRRRAMGEKESFSSNGTGEIPDGRVQPFSNDEDRSSIHSIGHAIAE